MPRIAGPLRGSSGPLVFDEPRLALHAKVAWPRQTDRHLQLDAARSGGEDDDAIGEIHGLGDVVGDEERGLARFVPHAEELLLHRLAGLRVEGGERLVEQKQLGIRREGARQVHPLLHATRELRRPRVVEAAKADELDEPLSDTARLSAGTPLHLEPIEDVAGDRPPREQARLLEHHRTVGSRSGDLSTVEEQRTRRDRKKAIDGVEERRLPASRWADDRDELAGCDPEVDPVNGDQRLAASLPSIMDPDASRLELGRHRKSVTSVGPMV